MGHNEKGGRVKTAIIAIEKERELGRFTAPDSTICDWLKQNRSKIHLDCSAGYLRGILPDKYKNMNQVAIAKRQPKGRLRTAIMHERKGRELQKEVQGLRNDII